MARYIVKRILQMIPTVFGVILITFVLFNVVGGSPASLTLGKNVSPKALEEFDEQRGFNKPLILGRWSGTRVYEDINFKKNAGAWKEMPGVVYQQPQAGRPGHITLTPEQEIAIPLAFPLREQTTYRWSIHYRIPQGRARLTIAQQIDSDSTNSAIGCLERRIIMLPGAQKWRKTDIQFTVPPYTAKLKITLRAEEGALELRELRLRRQNRHWLDSQFAHYLGQIARLDFGKSNYSNQRVSQMLKDGIGPSLCLAIPIFLIELVTAVSMALLCAFFRNTWLDRMLVIVAVALMSVNYLVWIIFGQYFMGYRMGWFPLWGFESWSYLLLPVLIGVISGLGVNLRFYRTIMLDEMYRDYVRTAVAKGAGRTRVLFVHVLKNAMIPILTNVVIAIPFLYTGNLLLESFFGIPGLGSMGINALNYSDVDVVRAIVLIGSIVYVFANLLTDLSYALFDPRVRLQ